jgi:hypothetical protein
MQNETKRLHRLALHWTSANVVLLAPEIIEDGDCTVRPTRQVSGSLGTVDKL